MSVLCVDYVSYVCTVCASMEKQSEQEAKTKGMHAKHFKREAKARASAKGLLG